MEQIFEYTMINLLFLASVVVIVQYKHGKISDKKWLLFFCFADGIGFLFGAAGKFVVGQNAVDAAIYLVLTVWFFSQFVIILLSNQNTGGK